MPKPGFEKIEHSDSRLFGPRKLLLCGFSDQAQEKFTALLEMIGIEDLPVVWVLDQQAEMTLQELIGLPSGAGVCQSSTLPRAIVVSGITENELHQLMSACRKTGMKQALWAALTPTSSTWRLRRLLAELSAEKAAMSRGQQPRR